MSKQNVQNDKKEKTSIEKERTSKGKEETSKEKERTSKGREETSKEKGRTSKGREETSKEREKTSKGRKKTSKEREKTSKEKEKTSQEKSSQEESEKDNDINEKDSESQKNKTQKEDRGKSDDIPWEEQPGGNIFVRFLKAVIRTIKYVIDPEYRYTVKLMNKYAVERAFMQETDGKDIVNTVSSDEIVESKDLTPEEALEVFMKDNSKGFDFAFEDMRINIPLKSFLEYFKENNISYNDPELYVKAAKDYGEKKSECIHAYELFRKKHKEGFLLEDPTNSKEPFPLSLKELEKSFAEFNLECKTVEGYEKFADLIISRAKESIFAPEEPEHNKEQDKDKIVPFDPENRKEDFTNWDDEKEL